MNALPIIRTNTILYCERWQNAVRFYRDVLKLPLVMEKEWFVEFRLCEVAFLSLADAGHTTMSGSGGAGLTLSWQVDDLAAVRKRLRAGNVAMTPVRSVWGADACYFFDPEGHRIEVWASAGKVPDFSAAGDV